MLTMGTSGFIFRALRDITHCAVTGSKAAGRTTTDQGGGVSRDHLGNHSNAPLDLGADGAQPDT